MRAMSRRLFLMSTAAIAALASRLSFAEEAPGMMSDGNMGGMSVREALARRKSTRLYSADPIDEAVLLRLLWSANGVNRPDIDGRTAPSWHGAKDTDIYAARASGVSRFDPKTNTLVSVLGEDIRTKTSPQPFVGTAPVILIYVSDRDRIVESAKAFEAGQPPEIFAGAHRIAAYVDTAVIAQNVYLFCAAEGLGTCLVGGSDPVAISRALRLPDSQMVTYVQPVGHPKG